MIYFNLLVDDKQYLRPHFYETSGYESDYQDRRRNLLSNARTSILSTYKTVYREALPVLYSNSKFFFRDPAPKRRFLWETSHQIWPEHHFRHVRHIVVGGEILYILQDLVKLGYLDHQFETLTIQVQKDKGWSDWHIRAIDRSITYLSVAKSIRIEHFERLRIPRSCNSAGLVWNHLAGTLFKRREWFLFRFVNQSIIERWTNWVLRPCHTIQEREELEKTRKSELNK